MRATCKVPGCTQRKTGYGPLCNAHKSRKRRHGHPQQQTITTAMVKPYRDAVVNWINTQPNAQDIWQHIESRWLTLVSEAEGILRLSDNGEAIFWPEREAAREVIRLHRNVELRIIIATISGTAYMLEADPRRFRDDTSYRFQLVRRVRGLTDVNAGTYYDHSSGRRKRVYRELSPRVVSVLAQLLINALGVVGHIIHQQIKNQHLQDEKAKMAFYEAMGVNT